MSEFRFVESPPLPSRQKRVVSPVLARFARALRERPGEWAVTCECTFPDDSAGEDGYWRHIAEEHSDLHAVPPAWPVAADVTAKVREIAAEHPDHRYVGSSGNAVYVQRGRDGVLRGACLIGAAFIALGVDPSRLAAVNHASVKDLLVADPSVPVVDWLGLVQLAQDWRLRWCDAVGYADGIATQAEPSLIQGGA